MSNPIGETFRASGYATAQLIDETLKIQEGLKTHRLLGQVLAMYTDGVTEAHSPAEDQYGDQRLEALVRQHAEEDAQVILDHIYGSVVEFVQGAPQHDDLTLVVMKLEDGDGDRAGG